MTEEERKRLALAKKKRQAELKAKNNQFFNEYRKGITGVAAGEKEIEMLTKSISGADLDEKFIAEKTGGAVSEEELKILRNMLRKN